MHAATASARYSPARPALQPEGSPWAPRSPEPAGRPPPSLGFPPSTQRGERLPQPDRSSSAWPPLPASPPFLTGSHHGGDSASRARGPDFLAPGPLLKGGRRVKGQGSLRRAHAPGMRVAPKGGAWAEPVCGRGFGRGLRPPPALGNLQTLRTTYTPPVTTLGCCEQRITPALSGAGSYFFPSFCQNILDLKTWNNHTFHKRDKE